MSCCKSITRRAKVSLALALIRWLILSTRSLDVNPQVADHKRVVTLEIVRLKSHTGWTTRFALTPAGFLRLLVFI